MAYDEIIQSRSIPTHSADALCEWFGDTDTNYLRAHFERFAMTHKFASETIKANSVILDVGAHWLHQAAIFAGDGHRLICADVYVKDMELCLPGIKRTAQNMGARVMNIKSLEAQDAFAELPDSSVDAVLFCEIIEHITFNPINMWKGFYRVLRPGGRIYITTPNSMHFKRLHQKLSALTGSCEYGIAVPEIFSHGTFGHHWKEFSIPELRRYFAALSPDFKIARAEARPAASSAYETFKGRADMAGACLLDQLVKTLEAAGAQPMGEQILLEISLDQKLSGIVIDSPW